MTNTSVVQQWMLNLSWKDQTTLLACLRASDTRSVTMRPVTRWLRGKLLNDADDSTEYMSKVEPTLPLRILKDEITPHFAGHLWRGLKILAICHPDRFTRRMAAEILTELEQFAFREDQDPVWRREFVSDASLEKGSVQ